GIERISVVLSHTRGSMMGSRRASGLNSPISKTSLSIAAICSLTALIVLFIGRFNQNGRSIRREYESFLRTNAYSRIVSQIIYRHYGMHTTLREAPTEAAAHQVD